MSIVSLFSQSTDKRRHHGFDADRDAKKLHSACKGAGKKALCFCAKGNLQDYKEHIHIQEQCLSHFQLIFMLSITDSKSMHTHGVKVIGKGSQFVPQRLVLLTAWLQRIRLNLLFADVTGPQSCRADMNSWSPASKARLRAWQYILSQGPAKNMATSI